MRNLLLVLALWAAGLGAAAQFGKISLIFDHLAAIYGGPAPVAFMVSVVGLVGLVLGTTAGILVQRMGYRRVLLGAMVMGAALSALQALMPGYALMMASRLLEGLSHLAIVVIAPVVIAQVTSVRHQGLAMTLWSSFFAVSFAGLATLAPLALDEGGPPALFLGHAVFMAAVTVVLAVLLPPMPPVAAPAIALPALIRQHGAIYRSPRIAAPAMGFFFYTILYVALLTLLPPMMGDQRMLAASAMPLVSIAVSLTLGVWAQARLGAVAVVQLGFLAGFLSALALGAFWQVETLRLAAALALAAAMGVVQGASFSAIPQLNAGAGDRMLASGAVAQLGNLGTTTGTPILAALIGGFGVAGVVGFALPLCLCGIAVHAVQRRRRAD